MNITRLLISQATQRPDAPAIIEGAGFRQRTITFAQLEARAARAAALLADGGVRAGDAVLVFVPMSIELYVALIAIFRIGAVATFLDPSAGREHIDRCCRIVPPAAFIAVSKAHLLRWITPALRRIPRAYAIGMPVPAARRWAALDRHAPHPVIAQREPDDPALITFTSGSTGQPKAAVRTHGFLAAQHAALASAIDLQPGQVDLATLPIFTLANLASGLTSLIPAADLRRPGSVRVAPILRQMRQHGPTRCVASPAFFERLLSHSGAAAAMHSLQRIDTGGAPVFPGLLQRLQTALPKTRISAVYGSTEAEPIAHIAWAEISPDDIAAMFAGRGLLAGVPVNQIHLRIIPNRWGQPIGPMTADQFEQAACPAGVAGEIVVNGPHVLRGYLAGHGDAETKFRVDDDVWHRTGDAGYLDAEGRLWLLGRAQARISDNRGTIYPFAVECAASRIDGVRRSALVQHAGKRLLIVEPTRGAPADLPDVLARQLPWARLDAVRLMRRIPVDRRHNAKIDYAALARRLQAAD